MCRSAFHKSRKGGCFVEKTVTMVSKLRSFSWWNNIPCVRVSVHLTCVWWRWRESNPRPKTHPPDFLRVQSVFWDSPQVTPTDRLHPTVSSCSWQETRKAPAHVHCSSTLLSGPQYSRKKRAALRQPLILLYCRLFLSLRLLQWIPPHYSLIGLQNPRRNPFIPIWQSRWLCSEI